MKTRLREDISYQAARPIRVDRDKGIAYDVVILGLQSDNGRSYSPDAIRRALSLYEGAKSNIDHPSHDEIMRSFAARFGRFHQVRFDGQRLRGDYYYNPKHPLAETFLFWCEHDPSAVGFSHNAEGETDEIDGATVVTRIDAVYSVDLVADPATTRGLSESLRSKVVDTEYAQFVEGLVKAMKDPNEDD